MVISDIIEDGKLYLDSNLWLTLSCLSSFHVKSTEKKSVIVSSVSGMYLQNGFNRMTPQLLNSEWTNFGQVSKRKTL